jgi:FtsH-binding integral membrane protein
MRTRVRRFAHVLERLGLAMAGAASGLFVAAHVGSSIGALTSQAFILVMMIAGATGFYLGIDTPPQAVHGPEGERKVDAADLLSALGTFLAAAAAFASVAVIVLREDLPVAGTILIMAGWVIGVTMQIVAGAIARTRA